MLNCRATCAAHCSIGRGPSRLRKKIGRRPIRAGDAAADGNRRVPGHVTWRKRVSGDHSRQVTWTGRSSGDLLRQVTWTGRSSGDLFTQVTWTKSRSEGPKCPGDLDPQVVRRGFLPGDLARKVVGGLVLAGDLDDRGGSWTPGQTQFVWPPARAARSEAALASRHERHHAHFGSGSVDGARGEQASRIEHRPQKTRPSPASRARRPD